MEEYWKKSLFKVDIRNFFDVNCLGELVKAEEEFGEIGDMSSPNVQYI